MKISELLFRVWFQPVLGMFLRAEEGMAKQAAATAAATGAGYGSTAAGERTAIEPFYRREMQAEHVYDPTQINELLTAAGAGTGAATGATEAALKRQQATTGNAAGAAKTLQEMQRDRMKAAAGTSEQIAGQDVQGALEKRQAGAAGMSGLYGENVKAQLEAMGQVAQDIQAATAASKSGWLQNAEGVVNTAANAAKAFKPI